MWGLHGGGGFFNFPGNSHMCVPTREAHALSQDSEQVRFRLRTQVPHGEGTRALRPYPCGLGTQLGRDQRWGAHDTIYWLVDTCPLACQHI